MKISPLDQLRPISVFRFEELVAPEKLDAARHEARLSGQTVGRVLLARGWLAENRYLDALASHYGLETLQDPADLADIELSALTNGAAASGIHRLRGRGRFGVAIDPSAYSETVLDTFLSRVDSRRGNVRLIAPSLVRTLEVQILRAARLEQAVNGLAGFDRRLSAHDGISYPQRLVLGFLAGLLGGGFAVAPVTTAYLLGGVCNVVFLLTILLRLYAVAEIRKTRNDEKGSVAGDDDLPVYSVLVPLYREARVVEPLVRHLAKLDYPHERLDIRLILEEDDRETLEAVAAHDLPPWFEVVRVPCRQPRTKPKALNYGMLGAKGRYVVVFDAEDRPEPDQLRKAVARFRLSDDGLACLQAGLNHYNHDQNWLARQFTIEYLLIGHNPPSSDGTRQREMNKPYSVTP